MEIPKEKLSVILPAHNEEANISPSVERISAILAAAEISHEIIFVDDGSDDQTWKEIQLAAQKFQQVCAVRFTRCFGKEAAIYAGLSVAKGNCSVVMDCDLQHPPEKLPEMWTLWQSGFEVVEGVKHDRGEESRAHGEAAKLFYKLISRAAGIDLSRSSDFKLLDRKVVQALLSMPERDTFFRALSLWTGFRTAQIEFDVQPRNAGKSNWSFWRLVKYAVSNIASFTAAPLYLIVFLGLIMLLAALLLGVEALWRYCIGGALEGFTTVILLQLFTGSILMISLGIIGYYLAKIYKEIKHRPRYIIAETLDSACKLEDCP